MGYLKYLIISIFFDSESLIQCKRFIHLIFILSFVNIFFQEPLTENIRLASRVQVQAEKGHDLQYRVIPGREYSIPGIFQYTVPNYHP